MPRVARLWFSVFPVGRIDDLLQARNEHGIEILTHLNKQIFSLAVVIPVQIDYGVAGRAGTSKIIQNYRVSLPDVLRGHSR